MKLSLCESGTEKDIEKYHLKGWIAQHKIDGCRCLAVCLNGQVNLLGRSGSDYTRKFNEVVEELKSFNGIFDGEIVCDTFEHTQSRVHTENSLKLKLLEKEYPAIFYVFDVLSYENRDLRCEMLSKRLKILAEMPLKSLKSVKMLDYTPDLINCWERAKELKWEGIIIKRLNSKYAGKRTYDWLKIKLTKSKDILVKSYEVNPAGIRVEDENGIAVQITGSQNISVKKELDERGECLIEVNYLNETDNGKLRQPTFKCKKE
jgi:ATP-dependent DNA ligase